MARRSLAQRLLGDELIEMRLMRLPLDARYVWEHLVEIVGRRGDNGTLRLGSELGSELGFAGWFAHWFRRPETEMETHFETLLRAGLLFIHDGLMSLPGLSGAAARRAETARANGLKGGRPPKNRAAAASDQSDLALRLPGNFTVVEKPSETQGETEAAHAQLASLEELSSREELAASYAASLGFDAADPERLVAELFAVMGVPRSGEQWLPDLVQGWLDRGIRPEQMRQVVQTERDKRRGKGREPVRTLGWFEEKMLAVPAGPRSVASAAPAVQPSVPAIPADPRVKHLSGTDRSYAERALFNLAKLGTLPEDAPVGSPAWQSTSFARTYCPAAYHTVTAIHPEVAAWFGDDVPGAQAAAG